MLEQLEKQLLELFLEERTEDPLSISALNVAALRLSQLPYFGNSYPDHILIHKGDDFYKCYFNFKKSDMMDRDPLREVYYDEFNDYDEDDSDDEVAPDFLLIHQPKWSLKSMDPFTGELPAEIERRANVYLEKLHERSELMRKASNPTPQELADRQNLAISLVPHEEIYPTLRAILGEGYSHGLKPNGIQYHDPSMGHHHSKEWFYLIAHNENEVAGVAGFTHQDHALGLSYVSVAPGFQNQGLSKRLYQSLIDYAQTHELVIRRSSPSEHTRNNPGITLAYDRLLEESQVLHTTSDTYLNKVLADALETQPYSYVLNKARDACNALTREKRKVAGYSFSGPAEELDRTLSAQLRETFAPTPKPRRPSP